MAILSGFYNSVNGDRKYDAEDFGRLLNGIIQPGVFSDVGNQLAVTAARSGLSARVDTGKAWVGTKYVELTSFETVVFNQAHPSLDRKDYVCLLVDNNTNTRAASVRVVAGSPAPKGPAVKTPIITQEANGYFYLPIAEVYIAAGATSLTNAEITTLIGTDRCPWVSGPNMKVNFDGLQTQLQSKFDTWFASVRDALDKAAGGNPNIEIQNLKSRLTTIESDLSTAKTTATQSKQAIDEMTNRFRNRNTLFTLLDNGNGGTHNSIWRGDNLGTTLSSAHQTAIRNGTFSGIWVGDYWVIGGVQWRVVGFDYFRNFGPDPWDRPHMVLMPDTSLLNAPWGSGNTSGGYANSSLLFKSAPAIASTVNRLRSMFGNNLNSPWHRVSTAADNGIVRTWDWEGTSPIELPSERMLFGQPVQTYAQSYTDARFNFSMMAQGQLPAFRLNPGYITSAKTAIWLSDIANNLQAFYLDRTGLVSSAPVTYNYGVRPFVVITA